jgi:hypothetical protein
MVTTTVFFIRKEDKKLLRRYVTTQSNKYFVKKQTEVQIREILDNYLDLERKDLIIREYEGYADSYER